MLDAPIRWQAAFTDPDVRDLLEDMQANILKSHGRHHAAHMALGFAGMAADDVAAVIRALGRHCTSAWHQLRTNRRYPPHLDGGPVRCLVLGAGGYKALGKHARMPEGEAFRAGMAARAGILADPPRQAWQAAGWRDQAPDAMVLLADADPHAVTRDLEAVERWLDGTGVRILVIERGLQQTRRFRPGEKPEAVEHFGYVDGRSQPIFLAEDLAREEQSVAAEPKDKADPGAPWSPRFKPSQFIVADPNGRRRHAAGSYFVFRKLEQDVRGFNAAEDALGRALFGQDAGDDLLELAGAMIVGRFEDGTPLVRSRKALGQAVPNGFTYDGDTDGAKCPFHAHIRKTNPRGDVQRQFGLPDASGDRNPIMARRGMTYGPKRPMSRDGSEFADKGKEPVQDSGLLFMAYMASIEAQFEFTQQSWANNADFVRPGTGVDPVIGQTADPAQRQHRFQDGHTPGATPTTQPFAQFVHLQGGEYFFAPSLSFLRGVGL
ncbi:hypothetical protein CKO45_06780 [Paracraurococcus ruber]|uniref:Peroxidase n=1 Tax=Paracraurococcus ruber TaxID=77675 RepID=A0ABS1CUA9_9PROT|nr:hypothetical protein [Paracraurococcus ruber]